MAAITLTERESGEIDKRPRAIRAGEQNFSQGYRLEIYHRSRTALFRRRASASLQCSYQTALRLREIFHDDYPIHEHGTREDNPMNTPASSTARAATDTRLPANGRPPEAQNKTGSGPDTGAGPIQLRKARYTAAQLTQIIDPGGQKPGILRNLWRYVDRTEDGAHYITNDRLVQALARYGIAARLLGEAATTQYEADPRVVTVERVAVPGEPLPEITEPNATEPDDSDTIQGEAVLTVAIHGTRKKLLSALQDSPALPVGVRLDFDLSRAHTHLAITYLHGAEAALAEAEQKVVEAEAAIVREQERLKQESERLGKMLQRSRRLSMTTAGGHEQ